MYIQGVIYILLLGFIAYNIILHNFLFMFGTVIALLIIFCISYRQKKHEEKIVERQQELILKDFKQLRSDTKNLENIWDIKHKYARILCYQEEEDIVDTTDPAVDIHPFIKFIGDEESIDLNKLCYANFNKKDFRIDLQTSNTFVPYRKIVKYCKKISKEERTKTIGYLYGSMVLYPAFDVNQRSSIDIIRLCHDTKMNIEKMKWNEIIRPIVVLHGRERIPHSHLHHTFLFDLHKLCKNGMDYRAKYPGIEFIEFFRPNARPFDYYVGLFEVLFAMYSMGYFYEHNLKIYRSICDILEDLFTIEELYDSFSNIKQGFQVPYYGPSTSIRKTFIIAKFSSFLSSYHKRCALFSLLLTHSIKHKFI